MAKCNVQGKTKSMRVQFKAVGCHAKTFGVGVEVSLEKFPDINSMARMLVCTVLQCDLHCDPSASRDEAEGQSKMVDNTIKVSFVGQTNKVSVGKDTASFQLQMLCEGNEEAIDLLPKFADKIGQMTFTVMSQAEEG